MAVVEKTVQDGGSDDVLAPEDLAPLVEGFVGSDSNAASFIPRTDQLEEKVCPAAVHGHVAQLIYYQEIQTLQVPQPPAQGAVHSAGYQVVQQHRSVGKEDASQALMARAMRRWVLPVPGGPTAQRFSARSRKSRRASSSISATGNSG